VHVGRAIGESLSWHLVERSPGVYDFTSLSAMVAAAKQHGVQVIWDLCHYGWPDDLDIFSPAFVDRFAAFSTATARYVRDESDIQPYYTPINEISFLAWAAGEVGWFFPHSTGRGVEIKRQLIRAAIAGIEAIWDVDSRARIVTVEPLIHVVPPRGKLDINDVATTYRNSQFEAWDMLTGRLAPELGGRERYLDVMGVNFYHDNQWEHPGGEKIAWHILPRDPRWIPFHQLFREAYERYRRPIFVAETSHVGSGRAEWLREMTDEIRQVIEEGIPIEGVCLYPILDRFDWNDATHWHNSGLWDLTRGRDGTYVRVLNEEYAAELRRSQQTLTALSPASRECRPG
jgi:beta-glucosidase/6-phospho-beta-glucosidase/beta-galactosidase